MKKIRILYDHQTFTFQKTGGVSRYFFELLKGLSHLDNVSTELALAESSNIYLKNAVLRNVKMPKLWEEKVNTPSIKELGKILIKKIPIFSTQLIYKHFRRFSPLVELAKINETKSIARLTQQQFDVFHPTYHNSYFLEYLRDKPLVITIHDMIHEKFCEEFPEYKTDELLWKKKIVARADQIIVISESTKLDLMSILHVPSEKITVIHHGPPLGDIPKKQVKGLPTEFILFVGDRSAYKNFEIFSRSFSELSELRPQTKLVVVGGGEYTKQEKENLKLLNIESSVLHFSRVSDSELAYIYSKATVFCFPSLYEGFGFPILEAFGHGCPVALSQGSSFNEVAGDAGQFFDPKNHHEIKKILLNILESPQLRSEMKKKGFEQLKLFSWERCIQDTLGVYLKARSKRL